MFCNHSGGFLALFREFKSRQLNTNCKPEPDSLPVTGWEYGGWSALCCLDQHLFLPKSQPGEK
jgi:hypothetical protein